MYQPPWTSAFLWMDCSTTRWTVSSTLTIQQQRSMPSTQGMVPRMVRQQLRSGVLTSSTCQVALQDVASVPKPCPPKFTTQPILSVSRQLQTLSRSQYHLRYPWITSRTQRTHYGTTTITGLRLKSLYQIEVQNLEEHAFWSRESPSSHSVTSLTRSTISMRHSVDLWI